MAAPSVARGSVKTTTSALSMSSPSDNDDERRFAASVLTAAYLFANVVSVAPAFAAPQDFAGSSQVVAAKSGGRMGGRSSSSMGSRPSSSSYSRSSSVNTHTSHTTVIQQPVYVAPTPVYGGYGYGLDAGTVGTQDTRFRVHLFHFCERCICWSLTLVFVLEFVIQDLRLV